METTPTPSPASRDSKARGEQLRAKIKARGQQRLDRITNMKEPSNEKPKPPVQPTPSENPQALPDTTLLANETVEGKSTPDPKEIDISEHHYVPDIMPRPSQTPPSSQQPQISDEEILRLMFGQIPPGAPRPAGMDTGSGDPLMSMLQRLIGGDSPGLNGDGATATPSPQVDPQQRSEDNSGFIWKILHAIFAFVLAVYIVIATSFVGTRASRLQGAPQLQVIPGVKGVNFFWLFATVELVLQSTRFFLEKGRAPRDSWMGKIASYLPPPFADYLVTLARYVVIFNMIVQDGMLIIFVLGCVAWWNGGVKV
ncbi:MAG: hypothetical protein M1839_000861 [Geoglossum umbratile]|nr:MAG: hypothetical protein M1839_000861 [Geoglossum umbratile]